MPVGYILIMIVDALSKAAVTIAWLGIAWHVAKSFRILATRKNKK